MMLTRGFAYKLHVLWFSVILILQFQWCEAQPSSEIFSDDYDGSPYLPNTYGGVWWENFQDKLDQRFQNDDNHNILQLRRRDPLSLRLDGAPLDATHARVQVRALVDGVATLVLDKTIMVNTRSHDFKKDVFGWGQRTRRPPSSCDLDGNGDLPVERVLLSLRNLPLKRDESLGLRTLVSFFRGRPCTIVDNSDKSDSNKRGSRRCELENERCMRNNLSRKVAPTIYLHLQDIQMQQRQRRRVLAYTLPPLMSLFNGGNLTFSLGPTPPPPPPRPELFLTIPPPVNSNSYDPLDPPVDPVPSDEILMCFQYNYLFVDSGLGEDFYTETDPLDMWMKARGIYVEVFKPDSGLVAGYTDSNGCIAVQPTPADLGRNWKVEPWARARLSFGNGNNENVRWSARYGGNSYEPNGGQQYGGPVFVNAADVGNIIYVPMANGGAVIDVMAGATHSVWRLITLLGSTMPTGVTFHMTTAGNPAYPDLCAIACASSSTLYYNPECGDEVTPSCDPQVTSEKFGLTHEVGHKFQSDLMSATSGGYTEAFDHLPSGVVGFCSWSSNFGNPLVLQGPGFHSLRSLEQSGTGFKEGYAHYISAVTWNRVREDPGAPTEGIFVYYKSEMDQINAIDPFYSDMDANNWRVTLGPLTAGNLGGVVNFRDNVCFAGLTPSDIDYFAKIKNFEDVHGNGDTEIDWLRFFWDLTNDPTEFGDPLPDPPTFAEATAFLGDGFNFGLYNSREVLWNGVQGKDWEARVEALALKHGVYPP